MISVVFCTRKSDPQYIEHLKKKFSHPKIEVIEYVNNGKSLTHFYNKGLKESKYDIVTFVHDDIIFESGNIANKIVKHFEKNTEYGIIGVAGTKYLSDTGRWWESIKDMYGKVWHQKDGKTWVSEYSKDMNSDLEEVVVVDGVFFSVHKKRIRKNFSKDVKGFHFYEIDFCLNNYLSGVKIGVHSNIHIIHKSIGMTNDEWESNRALFSEKYKQNLPIKISKKLRRNEKLDILFCSTDLGEESQKAKSIVEYVKCIKKLGHNVHVITSDTIKSKMICGKNNIHMHSLSEPPGFKIGDGKWQIMTQEGLIATEPGVVYKIKDVKYDIVHILSEELFEVFSKLYQDRNVVKTKYSDSIFSNMVSSEDTGNNFVDIPTDPTRVDNDKIKECIEIYESAI